jgi:hypothetical protein
MAKPKGGVRVEIKLMERAMFPDRPCFRCGSRGACRHRGFEPVPEIERRRGYDVSPRVGRVVV